MESCVNVLIVEDENVSRKALASLLNASGHAAEAVESAEEAILRLESGTRPQVAVVDVDLPGMTGFELIRRMKQLYPDIQPILVTAAGSERVAPFVLRESAAYLRKPIEFRDLLHVIARDRIVN